jgi:TRAP-type C4-dicarboxylate transport system permease small subunit
LRIWKSLYDGIYRIIDVIMIVSLIVMVLSVFTNVSSAFLITPLPGWTK